MKKYRKLLTDGAMSVLLLLLMTYERIGAAAFMLTGPSTKITNLGAVKIVLGVKISRCTSPLSCCSRS